jgi:hypothetical protein
MFDWSGEATKLFKGKVISHIRYTDADENEEMGWNDFYSAPIIFFTDGTWIMASADDEGNSSGSLFTSDDTMEIIPRGGR